MRLIRDIFRDHAVFDEKGRHVNGTDKQSNHNYGDAYEKILTEYEVCDRIEKDGSLTTWRTGRTLSLRNEVKLMMEVGVADGSCLLAWREVFPNALIVGMDVHPCEKANSERIEFHLGDQRSKADCDRAAAGRQFDLIVEDATHILSFTLRTLLFLWPYVKPSGLYVIEEFDSVGELRKNITELFPNARIVDTTGPFGGVEPMVVLRKPL